MTTLQDYITTTRRYLHDANANFWTDQELTDYINQGRDRLVRDTGINREIQNTVAINGQELYTFDNSAGTVSGILVTAPGTNFTSVPTVSLTPSPTGNNATATATIGGVGEYGSNNAGQISSINVTYAGSGYTTAPTVTITGGGGSGAAAQ